MLVLSRKEKESLLIGDNIEIIIQSIDKDSVKIAIVAPKDVKIMRKELVEQVTLENQQAIITLDPAALKSLLQLKRESSDE
ncbi:MAG: carbon storage regulator CsrA [Erysipelothrix sp.]|jgi:carbon storage regulator|nr:carbon storage regulator CsrA [Erysipelothrix sp.]